MSKAILDVVVVKATRKEVKSEPPPAIREAESSLRGIKEECVCCENG